MIYRLAAEIPSATAKKVFDVSGLFVAPEWTKRGQIRTMICN